MGRIVYGMLVSLDGYITSPDGTIGLAAPSAELHWYFNGVMKRTAISLYGRRMYETMKVWQDARLLNGNVEAAVRALKAETPGDIAVGGAGLAGSLSKLGLIDEYRLFLHPAVFGGGIAFFEAGTPLALKPLGREELPQGVTLLRYAPAG